MSLMSFDKVSGLGVSCDERLGVSSSDVTSESSGSKEGSVEVVCVCVSC